jgi:hypothetical protein
MISSISIILLSSCKKDKKEIHKSESSVMPVGAIKSFGEYYNKIKNMAPARKAEYIQDLNGKTITWPVTIVDKDKNEILQKRYHSANVIEFNDPAAPIGIMLCYNQTESESNHIRDDYCRSEHDRFISMQDSQINRKKEHRQYRLNLLLPHSGQLHINRLWLLLNAVPVRGNFQQTIDHPGHY